MTRYNKNSEVDILLWLKVPGKVDLKIATEKNEQG